MADVAVVVTTYFPPEREIGFERMRAALAAVRSWYYQLSGATLAYVIADDGSEIGALEEFSYMLQQLLGSDWRNTSTYRLGCGGALNAGVQYVVENNLADVIFYAQDDWMLTDELDLAPSLKLIRGGNSVVRLGPTHPNLLATVNRLNETDVEWTLNYLWSGGGYVVGWRPAVYDARWLAGTLGGLEGMACIEAERVWLERIAATDPPPLVAHAPNCTLAGPFRHIETVELGEDAPETLTERYASG